MTATATDIQQEIELAEKKAWEALARYKFVIFGYWAGVWVHLNRIEGSRRPNPWKELVTIARTTTTVRTGTQPPQHNNKEKVQGSFQYGT